jgi:aryl-alcohol dehydrogenase-like predicted oxidoreductase
VLRHAIELGVDHIDTSQYYGPDVVNDLICEALYPYPENLKLVTKVGWRRDGAGRVLRAQQPDELREGVEANLRSLRVERLDLVNLRLVGAGQDAAIPLEEQLSELEDMRTEGKLDLIGLSNVDRVQARSALELVDVAAIQNGYSIIDRQSDEMVDFARERDIAFVPFFPLGSAFNGGPKRLAGEPAIVQVADKHGATPAQIAPHLIRTG